MSSATLVHRIGVLARQSGFGQSPWKWRLPPIEAEPALIAFVQTVPGRLVLCLSYVALLLPLGGLSWQLVLALSLIASVAGAASRHRALVMAVAGGGLLLFHPAWFAGNLEPLILGQERLQGTYEPRWIRTGSITAVLLLALAALWLARRWRNRPAGQRPVLAAHLICFGMIGLGCTHWLRGMPQVTLWSLTAVLAGFLWYLCYALLDQRSREPQPTVRHLAAFHPFFAPWGTTPIGRGAAAWRGVEAGTSDELAATQLSGLKLLAWAFILKAVLWLMHRALYDLAGITPLAVSFRHFLDSGVGPGPSGLLGVLINFPEQLLGLAIWGHKCVALARLAGFRLLRNTYRPLSARSIAEFWNRFDYYFKEALVHLYFYPTYLRCFKRHPRLRLAFATFMAAGVGNYLAHQVLRRLPAFAEQGIWETLVQSQTYAFYCFLLSGGIILSQLAARKPDPQAPWWRRQLLPSLGVMTFFCLLSFLDGPFTHAGLERHLAFLLNVLGMTR